MGKYYDGVGITSGMDLNKACADFYLLERMASDRNKLAQARMLQLETRLAKEFGNYFTFAIAGELSYAKDETHDNDRWVTCSTCYGDGVFEDSEGDTCDCDDCGGDGGTYKALESDAPSMPKEVRTFLSYKLRIPRKYKVTEFGFWHRWLVTTEEAGGLVNMLDLSVQVFEFPTWSTGFGGKPWANIAKLTRDYYRGLVKPRTFVDRCWSLEHNGGCAFNKTDYQYTHLMNILVKQSEEDYGFLLSKCSTEVADLWMRRDNVASGRDPAWLGVTHGY